MTRRQFTTAGVAAAALSGSKAKAATFAGYFVPAEEGPHERCFMQWPTTPEVYPSRRYREDVQGVIANIANAIADFEPVVMLADENRMGRARRQLSAAVEIWDIPTDDLWCRDAGPLFVVNDAGDMAICNVNFNGWGGRQRVPNDSVLARRVADHMGLRVFDSGVIGEPGGVETDGHGLLMAHESCWVNPNRNPGLSRDQIERRLLAAYGAERMIWAPGLKGQDVTDDHIDGLARFTGPRRAVLNMEEDGDPNELFQRAALQTYNALIAGGVEVDVIPYAVETRIDDIGSYVNFYAANGAVIASQFGDPKADDMAYDTLHRHYPEREVIMLNTDLLTELGGGIHCSTQQMPLI